MCLSALLCQREGRAGPRLAMRPESACTERAQEVLAALLSPRCALYSNRDNYLAEIKATEMKCGAQMVLGRLSMWCQVTERLLAVPGADSHATRARWQAPEGPVLSARRAHRAAAARAG